MFIIIDHFRFFLCIIFGSFDCNSAFFMDLNLQRYFHGFSFCRNRFSFVVLNHRPVVNSIRFFPHHNSVFAKNSGAQLAERPHFAEEAIILTYVTAMEALDAVERLLDRKRVLRRADVEGYVPDPKAQLERNARRGAYVDRMMRAAQAEIAETTASGNSKVDDEALAAVSS